SGAPRTARRLPRCLQRARRAMARRRSDPRHPERIRLHAARAAPMIAAVPPPPPARVQVVAREFSLALSRRTVKVGTAIIELANFGEDAHDLRMQRVGGARVYAWPIAQSGGVEDKTVRLLR